MDQPFPSTHSFSVSENESVCYLIPIQGMTRKLNVYIYISLNSEPETPPDSGIRGKNVLLSFRKAGHTFPTPFPRSRELLCNDCSNTIVTTRSGLRHFPVICRYFFRSCFYCNYCCSVFLLFFSPKWPFQQFSEM